MTGKTGMKLAKKPVSGFYFITDRRLSRNGVVRDAAAAVRGGARIVQYREKDLPAGKMIGEASAIRRMCRDAGVLFIVNDRVDVALASGADGVHIGPHDIGLKEARMLLGTDKIIGVTASSVAEAKRLESEGADYVGLSPVFATSTKKDAGRPVGVETIAEAKKAIRIPLVAIGGISEANLASVLDAGADAVCMISAVLAAKDGKGVEEKVREIRRLMHEHSARKGKG